MKCKSLSFSEINHLLCLESSKGTIYTKDFEVDGEVKEGLYKCIKRIVSDPNKQDEIHNKLLHFNESLSIIDLATTVRSRIKDPPSN